MATLAKNMDADDIGPEALVDETYSDEVMCAEWNPQLALMNESLFARTGKHAALPAALAAVDVDAFLKRIYEYQN
jgi:hypothetical protein